MVIYLLRVAKGFLRRLKVVCASNRSKVYGRQQIVRVGRLISALIDTEYIILYYPVIRRAGWIFRYFVRVLPRPRFRLTECCTNVRLR